MNGFLKSRFTVAAAVYLGATLVAFGHDPKKERGAIDEMCGEHHSAAMKASEATTMHLAEAKRAGTLGEVRKHVEAAQKAHADMEKHLSACTGMMSKMHGGAPGHQHGTMGGTAAGVSSAKPIDPVCQMEVDSKTAPSSTYKGKTYYFCSADDKAAFDKNPDKYVRGK